MNGRRGIPNMFRLRRAWQHAKLPMFLADDMLRFWHVVQRARISEGNRRVRLEQRSDADARLAAAQTKRARRNTRRRYEADYQLHGVITAHWIMGSHA